MSFNEKIVALSQRASSLVDSLHTEEATKTALVMPFIAALGYDIFDPREVVPEFTADLGTKKGEKVDYAIMQNGEIIVLVECKRAGDDLTHANMSQLFRYFSVTNARIAILTNGLQYRLFSDLEEPNKMDTRPFMELDLLDLRDTHLAEIKKLSKENFDLERMLDAATELKYTREIRNLLHEQFENPDEDFVRFFFTKANPGSRFVASAREQFGVFVHKAMQQYINERVNNRLRNALQHENGNPPGEADPDIENEAQEDLVDEDNGIVTTEDEIEGFHIVRAIVREKIAAHRIVYRDTKSYMGILLDDNNRKPICRLRFNYSQKYLGVFDEEKQETKLPLESLDDIYKYAEQLQKTALHYEE